MTTSPPITVYIGQSPDAFPTVTLYEPTATYEIVKAGLGVYLLRVTLDGEGVVQGFVSWEIAGVPGQFTFAFSFFNDPLTPDLLAKLGLIGTAQAQLNLASTAGQLTGPIIIGDDYKTANARAIVVTFPSTFEVSACKLGFYRDADNSVIVSGTAGALTDGEVELTYQIDRTETEDLKEGLYKFSAEVIDGAGNEVTVLRGAVQFTFKQTY
jgi:hypothetical protein